MRTTDLTLQVSDELETELRIFLDRCHLFNLAPSQIVLAKDGEQVFLAVQLEGQIIHPTPEYDVWGWRVS
jgi:hypothetical protein